LFTTDIKLYGLEVFITGSLTDLSGETLPIQIVFVE